MSTFPKKNKLYKILLMLEDINDPSDIKKLDFDQLQLLADEIKEFLIASIKKTGGHLGSNL